MSMPETAVDENHGAAAWKHNVWLSRKIANMQPEAVAASVNCASQEEFRLRVTASDPLHIKAARRRIMDVRPDGPATHGWAA